MSRNRSPNPKQKYPLKMETIPIVDDIKQNLVPGYDESDINIFNEGEEIISQHRAKTYESDEGFKFKRHKTNKTSGVPSLGERLDNFQDIQKAKWMDNFNSSMPDNQTQMEYNYEEHNNDQNKGRKSRSTPVQQISYSQGHQPSEQPYIPYMYYYPVPSSTHPMAAYNSPGHPNEYEYPQMRIGSSMPIYYAPQPGFYPKQPYFYSQDSSGHNQQLMPAPQLHPQFGVMNPPRPYPMNSKNKRRSLAEQRGRRASRLFTQDEHLGIISPHKDVPAQDFYRHIGNSSFGKDLQIRQLFSWCAIRALRNLEKEWVPKSLYDKLSEKGTDIDSDGDHKDPKQLTLELLKEFVSDLRKDKINIRWDYDSQESYDESIENTEASGDDVDLEFDEHIFDDTEDNIGEGILKKRKNKKTNRKSNRKEQLDKIKIPNIKNIENERNLNSLNEKIDKYKEEIANWTSSLNLENLHPEWDKAEVMVSLNNESTEVNDNTEELLETLKDEFSSQMDRLSTHSHLLQATSKALSELTISKLETLTYEFNKNVRPTKKEINSKTLLLELSNALNN